MPEQEFSQKLFYQKNVRLKDSSGAKLGIFAEHSVEKSTFPESVKEAMKRISKLKVITSFFFDKIGSLLLEIEGNEAKAFPDTKQGWENWDKFVELGRQNPGWIFLHNHPGFDNDKKPKPVTFEDVYPMRKIGASIIIAVHYDGTYSSIEYHSEQIDYWDLDRLRALANDRAGILDIYSGFADDQFWRENSRILSLNYKDTAVYS